MHFALLVAKSALIQPADLRVTGGWGIGDHPPAPVQGATASSTPRAGTVDVSRPDPPAQAEPLEAIAQQLRQLFAQAPGQPLFQLVEELVVRQAFEYCAHNQVHTASLLGISRNVMRTLLKRYHFLPQSGEARHSLGGESEVETEAEVEWIP